MFFGIELTTTYRLWGMEKRAQKVGEKGFGRRARI